LISHVKEIRKFFSWIKDPFSPSSFPVERKVINGILPQPTSILIDLNNYKMEHHRLDGMSLEECTKWKSTRFGLRSNMQQAEASTFQRIILSHSKRRVRRWICRFINKKITRVRKKTTEDKQTSRRRDKDWR